MKTVNTSKIAVASVMAMICMAGHALAATVVRPTSYTSDISVSASNGSIEYTINGNGLGSALETGDEVPATLPTHVGLSYPNNTTGARWGIGSGTITYNLGGSYELGSVLFWNYSEVGNFDRGIKTVTASFSTDGSVFTGDTTLNFAQASGTGQTVDLQAEGVDPSDLSGVTHVRFTDFVNHDGDAFNGYAEIRFTDISVPEPSTLALLGAGGAMLLAARRRVGRK